jgi:murein DD-endopeptidase MepM/ murein hydrolase activator NlpD
MPVFPLAAVPTLDYHSGPSGGHRYFGCAERKDKDGHQRTHAACDLIAPKGAKVFAVAKGEVIRNPYEFYHGVQALEVRHTELLSYSLADGLLLPIFTFVVRYCEIGDALGLRKGAKVTEGQLIGHIGKMHRDSMLHLEMYADYTDGPLTQRHNHVYEFVPNSNYQRRSDLLDPTPFLDAWKDNLPGS